VLYQLSYCPRRTPVVGHPVVKTRGLPARRPASHDSRGPAPNPRRDSAGEPERPASHPGPQPHHDHPGQCSGTRHHAHRPPAAASPPIERSRLVDGRQHPIEQAARNRVIGAHRAHLAVQSALPRHLGLTAKTRRRMPTHTRVAHQLPTGKCPHLAAVALTPHRCGIPSDRWWPRRGAASSEWPLW
jgi:hypothetical protein